MNRRDFLASMFTAAAAPAILDLDRLLWVPGAKTIFLPSAPKIIAPPAHSVTGLGLVWLGTAGEHLISGDMVAPTADGLVRRLKPGETHPMVGIVAQSLASRGQFVMVHNARGIPSMQLRRTPQWERTH